MQPTLKDAIKYARENPESAFAKELKVRINSGKFDTQQVDSALNELDAEQQVANKPQDGFVDSIIKDIANPFLRVAETATRFGTGAAGLVKAGAQALTGDTAGAKETAIKAGQSASEQKINLPYFGAPQAVENPQQAIGVGADLASKLYGGGAVASTGKAVLKEGGKEIAKQTIKQIAKQTGKVGFATGAAQGFGNAMQQEKTIGGVITDTALGGVVGGATGAVVGAGTAAVTKIPSAISKYVAGKAGRVEATNLEKAVNIAQPAITPKLEQLAAKEGRLTEQGAFKAAKILPTKQELDLAATIKPYIDAGEITAKQSPVKVQKILSTKVSDLNAGVNALLSDPVNNQPFNSKQLVKALNSAKSENRILFGGDNAAIKAYDTVIQEFKNKFLKVKNAKGLFEARQQFDAYIRKNFPKAFEEDVLTGAVNPRYQALHDVRTVANQFISDLLPVNNPYRAILKQESNMLRIIDNLSTKVKGTTKGGKYTEALKKYGKRAGLAGGAIGVYQTIKK